MNISTFRTDKYNEISGIFENDIVLDLYITIGACTNLRKRIPTYVNVYYI